ncbi:MAG: hypothetical protein ACOVOQ_11655 [Flavobacterium sp.]
MKILTILFFVLLTNISFGQQKKYDTLFFANKKYLLAVDRNFKDAPFDFPFAIAEQHYKSFYSQKNKVYKALDYCGCPQIGSFTASGNEIISYRCDNYKVKEYNLVNYEDSVALDISNNFGKIYIKVGTTKYLIEKIQFIIVLDSNLLIVNSDINQSVEDFSWQIRDALYKEKPNFIILNQMLYTDKKGQLQLVPRQFIITTK